MHFSHLNNGSGSKATKIAVVAGFHVLLATVFIHSMNTRHITMPKVAVWRSFVMNHVIHHRAQLSVYLRMQDVPIPAMYGPSADETA